MAFPRQQVAPSRRLSSCSSSASSCSRSRSRSAAPYSLWLASGSHSASPNTRRLGRRVRERLDAGHLGCQSRSVKSCGPSGSQDLAFLAEQARRPPPFLGCTLTMERLRQPVATHSNGFRLFEGLRGRSICRRLRTVATTGLHKGSILRCLLWATPREQPCFLMCPWLGSPFGSSAIVGYTGWTKVWASADAVTWRSCSTGEELAERDSAT